MITVKLYNDGKEKSQSFEASLDENSSTIYLEGYGKDREEAIENLKSKVEAKIKEFQSIDYDNCKWTNGLTLNFKR